MDDIYRFLPRKLIATFTLLSILKFLRHALRNFKQFLAFIVDYFRLRSGQFDHIRETIEVVSLWCPNASPGITY